MYFSTEQRTCDPEVEPEYVPTVMADALQVVASVMNAGQDVEYSPPKTLVGNILRLSSELLTTI